MFVFIHRTFMLLAISLCLLAQGRAAGRPLTKSECESAPVESLKRSYESFVKWYAKQHRIHRKIAMQAAAIYKKNKPLFEALMSGEYAVLMEWKIKEKFEGVVEPFNALRCGEGFHVRFVFEGEGEERFRVPRCFSPKESIFSSADPTPDFSFYGEVEEDVLKISFKGYTPAPKFDQPYFSAWDTAFFMRMTVYAAEGSDLVTTVSDEVTVGFSSKLIHPTDEEFRRITGDLLNKEAFFGEHPECREKAAPL